MIEDRVEVPQELYDSNKTNLEVCIDIMYLFKRPHLVTISKRLHYGTAEKLPN